MNNTSFYDFDQLTSLLQSLYLITGRKITLKNRECADIVSSTNACDFCKLIQSTPTGYNLCMESDIKGLTNAKKHNKAYTYRCHAGLIETAIPIMEHDEFIGYLMVGQVLDDSPTEEQWERIERCCQWHHDVRALRSAFEQLDHLDSATMTAYVDILSTCASYIWLREHERQFSISEKELLRRYIDNNYMQPLSLKKMSTEMGIGRTKLCETAKKEFSCSVHQLIRRRRVAEAVKLLSKTNMSISRISETVGIGDSNYFTKVFCAVTGDVPRVFRKKVRKDPELMAKYVQWDSIEENE